MKNSVLKANVNTMKWFKAAGVRAVKTMAQTAVAMLPASAMINAVDWKTVVGTAALAGVASLLTSVAGIPEVEEEEMM
jgi:hypothetical protein